MMSEVKFPKTKVLHEVELEVWNFVFDSLKGLEKRLEDLEKKVKD